jgi:hypothetical protein
MSLRGGIIYLVSGNNSVYNFSGCVFDDYRGERENIQGGFINFGDKPYKAEVCNNL